MSAPTRTPERSGPCGGCGGGCGGCGGAQPGDHAEGACGLDCQVRPRFFCGQLLTDEDLGALVGWTSGKLALQRFRDGWGVVCGLEVRCDPRRPLGVLVGTGYAVTCCGEDVVLCAEEPLDLAAAAAADDPCADPASVVVPAAPITGTSSAAVAAMRERLAGSAASEGGAGVVEPRVVDVVMRYAERDADPRASLRHTECVQAPECEPARTAESFTLHWVAAGDDPDAAAATAWCAGYTACLDVVRRFVDEVGGSTGTEKARRAWLVRWIDAHPPHVFGALRDRVCSWTDAELSAGYGQVLTALVLECRRAFARTGCLTCRAGSGVRLARVRIGQVAADTPIRVLSVDTDPPYRRPHGPSTPPAPHGATNIGALVGMRWAEAVRRLQELGVPAEPRAVDTSLPPSDLAGRLDCGCGPIVAAGAAMLVDVAVLDGEERVVGFCASATTNGAAVPEPAVPAAPDPAPANSATQDPATPASAPPTEETLRTVEITLLTMLPHVGSVVAGRLHDAGLTVERIAAVPDAERPQMEGRIRDLLQPQHRDGAAAVVDAARRIHAGGSP